ncbi:CbtB domain-containing protein [Microvirga yunnanensis]|uniref:CbtB domain-containing protein n=1 Tax=Microvirga yunnanensis TaxID=2953740 RepID=UPI0021C90A82|nr:CbtB domain-containing protein [Microvirga sp. HBU65207]
MSTLTHHVSVTASSQRLVAILTAATFGLALVFISGFASPEALHNASHDWRHSHNFPCH